MTKRRGNSERMTFNCGHDVAKTRLSAKLKCNGFDIYEIRRLILNHVTIQELAAKKAIKIGNMVGQNFVIGAKDALLAEYRQVNYINRGCTVIQAVNNILDSIMASAGFAGYGKTGFWRTIEAPHAVYSKRIYIGSDQLTRQWMLNTYVKPYQASLTDKQKIDKYN